jgi:hypothetical protein
MMNTKNELHFILSANAPVIKSGVITANIIWYDPKVTPGMVGA